jgi:hypothetical protein
LYREFIAQHLFESVAGMFLFRIDDLVFLSGVQLAKLDEVLDDAGL